MPAINPTIELLRRELLRFGPYGAWRDRIELVDNFERRPGVIGDWSPTTLNPTQAQFHLFMVANPNWALTGAGTALSADQTLSADGGCNILTDGGDNDQCILFPRGTLGGVVSTPWAALTLEPQHEARIQFIVDLPVIANITLQFGLGLLANFELGGAGQIDADYAKIQFSTEGAVSTTKFTALDGIAGTDVETELDVTVEADKTYNLEIRYSSTGVARFYVNGVKKHTTAAHTAAAALKPVFGCQGLAVAETNFNIRSCRVSRLWHDTND